MVGGNIFRSKDGIIAQTNSYFADFVKSNILKGWKNCRNVGRSVFGSKRQRWEKKRFSVELPEFQLNCHDIIDSFSYISCIVSLDLNYRLHWKEEVLEIRKNLMIQWL